MKAIDPVPKDEPKKEPKKEPAKEPKEEEEGEIADDDDEGELPDTPEEPVESTQASKDESKAEEGELEEGEAKESDEDDEKEMPTFSMGVFLQLMSGHNPEKEQKKEPAPPPPKDLEEGEIFEKPKVKKKLPLPVFPKVQEVVEKKQIVIRKSKGSAKLTTNIAKDFDSSDHFFSDSAPIQSFDPGQGIDAPVSVSDYMPSDISIETSFEEPHEDRRIVMVKPKTVQEILKPTSTPLKPGSESGNESRNTTIDMDISTDTDSELNPEFRTTDISSLRPVVTLFDTPSVVTESAKMTAASASEKSTLLAGLDVPVTKTLAIAHSHAEKFWGTQTDSTGLKPDKSLPTKPWKDTTSPSKLWKSQNESWKPVVKPSSDIWKPDISSSKPWESDLHEPRKSDTVSSLKASTLDRDERILPGRSGQASHTNKLIQKVSEPVRFNPMAPPADVASTKRPLLDLPREEKGVWGKESRPDKAPLPFTGSFGDVDLRQNPSSRDLHKPLLDDPVLPTKDLDERRRIQLPSLLNLPVGGQRGEFGSKDADYRKPGGRSSPERHQSRGYMDDRPARSRGPRDQGPQDPRNRGDQRDQDLAGRKLMNVPPRDPRSRGSPPRDPRNRGDQRDQEPVRKLMDDIPSRGPQDSRMERNPPRGDRDHRGPPPREYGSSRPSPTNTHGTVFRSDSGRGTPYRRDSDRGFRTEPEEPFQRGGGFRGRDRAGHDGFQGRGGYRGGTRGGYRGQNPRGGWRGGY